MPDVRYTNDEIQALVGEPKPVPRDAFTSLNYRERSGHDRADLNLEGDDGTQFVVKLRKSQINPRDFHIHTATERYQERGFAEDAYAQQTDRYSSFCTALRCLVTDCGFYSEQSGPPDLFQGPL